LKYFGNEEQIEEKERNAPGLGYSMI